MSLVSWASICKSGLSKNTLVWTWPRARFRAVRRDYHNARVPCAGRSSKARDAMVKQRRQRPVVCARGGYKFTYKPDGKAGDLRAAISGTRGGVAGQRVRSVFPPVACWNTGIPAVRRAACLNCIAPSRKLWFLFTRWMKARDLASRDKVKVSSRRGEVISIVENADVTVRRRWTAYMPFFSMPLS